MSGVLYRAKAACKGGWVDWCVSTRASVYDSFGKGIIVIVIASCHGTEQQNKLSIVFTQAQPGRFRADTAVDGWV